MRGKNDKDNDAGRQPPDVLAAAIAALIQEVSESHVRRLATLRDRLQSDAFAWDHAALGQAIAEVHSAGREMHVRELRQGWLDKLLGEHRSVYARFVAAYDRIVVCAARLKMQASELAASSQSHNARARTMLMDLEMELDAVQAQLERGVAWLQDMCAQLGQVDEAGHADPRMAECAQAAHTYTERLKQLHAIASVGSHVGVRGKDVLARRAALVAQVRADVENFEKHWMRAVANVAAEVRAGRDPGAASARIHEAHDEFMKRLSLSADASSALQGEEHLFTQQLMQLRVELDALCRAAS